MLSMTFRSCKYLIQIFYCELKPFVSIKSSIWHRRSWVIFRGGPTIPSCQNSILSCQYFFLSGGAKFPNSVLPNCSAQRQKWQINKYAYDLVCHHFMSSPFAVTHNKWVTETQKLWDTHSLLWGLTHIRVNALLWLC